MRIASIWIPVDQWQAARRFYGEVLGLHQTECDDGIGRAVYAMDGGPQLILLRRPDRAGRNGGAVVRLECASVEELRSRLSRAGARVEAHVQESLTARVLTFYDPDGNCLEATQRMA